MRGGVRKGYAVLPAEDAACVHSAKWPLICMIWPFGTEGNYTHRQVLEGVGGYREVCSEQVLIQLMGWPLHDGCVHSILHCQHGTHASAKFALKPFKESLTQSLHPINASHVMHFACGLCCGKVTVSDR